MRPQQPMSDLMLSRAGRAVHVTWPPSAMSPQGIEDKFLEQWHQKLHTNTTPC